jgi:hypothetical protein
MSQTTAPGLRGFVAASAVALAGLGLAGCANVQTTHSLYEDVGPTARKAPAAVVRGQPNRPYRELGVVRVRGDSPLGFLRPKPSALVGYLRAEAGRIGADAVVLPAGAWLREPGGYYPAVAIEWASPSALSPRAVAAAPAPPAPPAPREHDDAVAPAVPTAGPPTPLFEEREEADGSWKRYVSTDGGQTWTPAPDDPDGPPPGE